MARRAADGQAPMRAGSRAWSRAWRTAAVAVAAAATFGLASTVAHADEPAPVPDTDVADSSAAVGEFDGAEVGVDLPPVPPTTIADAVDVAVDVPPVPPITIADAIEVAVDVPPVPSVTIPDAPIVASEAPVPTAVPNQRADKQADAESLLPETGAAAAGATAIVAGAAVSIGVALRALANRA